MRAALGKQIPFTRVDEHYFKVLRINALLLAGGTTVPLLIFGFFFGRDGFPGALWWVFAALALLASLILLFYAKRRARALGYFEGENELIIHKGIMFQKLIIVPYGRMQQVNVESGPILGRYNLANVELVTAAADTNAKIPGLTRTEAERLRQELTNLGSSQLEGL